MPPLNNPLFSSELWKAALEKYALATNLTIQLYGADGRVVFGPIHSTPLFQLFQERKCDPGILATCARRCLAQAEAQPALLMSQYHGLAAVGTSLVLSGEVVGAAVGGYALTDFCQVSEVQILARHAGIGFDRVWEVVRSQRPVPQRQLIVYGELLQVLGDALLRENYRTRQCQELIDALPVAVYTTDAQGRITLHNQAAAEFTGGHAEVGTDKWCVSWRLYRPDGTILPHDESPLAVTVRTGKPMRGVEVIVERPDGTRASCIPFPTAVRDASGVVVGGINVLVDITDRKQSEEALRENEEKFKLLFERSPLPKWAFEAETLRFVDVNKAAVELYGYSREEFLRMTALDVRIPEASDALKRMAARPPQRLPETETCQHHKKNGAVIDVEVRSSKISLAGKPVWLANIVDITETKRAEEERGHLLAREQQARQEAEAANRIKDEFLAVVSHELRNPLAPILMWTNILKSEKDPAQISQAIEVIERNAALQLRLLEDLLDLNRVQQGKIRLDIGGHDLSNILQVLVESVQVDAKSKRLTLELTRTGEPVLVEGDSARLHQIFANILSNAVKFTPAGGTIQVALAGESNTAVVKVRDTGEGIAPEFLPHVFEMFRQQEQVTRRTHSGLGIGLALVKNLVDLHGGRIEIRSGGPGLGTEVTVRLRRFAAAPEAAVPRVPEPQYAACSPLRGLSVLLVEDSEDSRKTMELMLRRLGAQVSLANDGRQALNVMETDKPDLILCDLCMPRMDGFEFVSELRRTRGLALPPVIAISALASEADHQRTRAAGFAGHLDKPFNNGELLSVIIQARNAA